MQTMLHRFGLEEDTPKKGGGKVTYCMYTTVHSKPSIEVEALV